MRSAPGIAAQLQYQAVVVESDKVFKGKGLIHQNISRWQDAFIPVE
jgi:hypothetical protein